MLSSVVIAICCLTAIPATQKDGDATRAVLRDLDSSWKAYIKEAANKHCFATSKTWHDDQYFGAYQFSVYFQSHALVSVARSFQQDSNGWSPPGISLKRCRNGRVEQFALLFARDASDIPDISPQSMKAQKDWLLRDERILALKPDELLTDFAKKSGLGLFDSFRFAPTWIYRTGEFLGSSSVKIELVETSAERIKIKFINDPPASEYRSIKEGTITFLKKSHWLVSESSVEFVNNRITREWTASRGTHKMKYTTLGDLTVPLSSEDEAEAFDEQNTKHVVKTKNEYVVTKIEDETPFSLTTYGIPDRTLQPKPPVEDVEEPEGTFQALPTLWNQTPLWGWLTAFGIVIVVVGILIHLTRRKQPAK